MLSDSAKAQQAQLDSYKEEMEAISARLSLDIKEKLERILNVSLAAGKQAMGEILQQRAESSGDAVRDRIDSMLRPIAAEMRTPRQIAMLNIFAAFARLAAAVLSMCAILR